jgi:uncharacterized MAPEG superfamily protein
MLFEYQCLTAITLFFILAWLPVSVGKWQGFGLRWLASNRTPVVGKELPPWAARCDRAYNNLKDYFPAYVVAIVLLGLTQKFDQGTSYAALIFVMARIGHYISYGIGNVIARATFFFAGLLSNIYLLIKILI